MSQASSPEFDNAVLVVTRDQGAIDAARGGPTTHRVRDVLYNGRAAGPTDNYSATWLMLENANAAVSGFRSIPRTDARLPAIVLSRGLSDFGAPVNVSCMGGGALRINALAAPDPFGAAGSSR